MPGMFASAEYYLHKLWKLAKGQGDRDVLSDPLALQVQLYGTSTVNAIITAPLPAGTNNIGDVDIASMPTIANSTKVSPVGGSIVSAGGATTPIVGVLMPAQSLYVRAKVTNTGAIYLGSSTVDSVTSQQIILLAGQAVTFGAAPGYRIDVNEFYFDVAVNGEGIDFLYLL